MWWGSRGLGHGDAEASSRRLPWAAVWVVCWRSVGSGMKRTSFMTWLRRSGRLHAGVASGQGLVGLACLAAAGNVVWVTSTAGTTVGAPCSAWNRGGGPSFDGGGLYGRVGTRRLDIEVMSINSVSLLERSSNAYHRHVKLLADAMHDISRGCLLPAGTSWWFWWMCHV